MVELRYISDNGSYAERFTFLQYACATLPL